MLPPKRPTPPPRPEPSPLRVYRDGRPISPKPVKRRSFWRDRIAAGLHRLASLYECGELELATGADVLLDQACDELERLRLVLSHVRETDRLHAEDAADRETEAR